MIKQSKRYSSDEERTLLTALIVHDRVLERVTIHLKGEKKPFRSRWSNLVAGWCFDYYRKYNKAPRKAVQSLFSKYALSATDKESIQTVESFLEGLNEDFLSLSKDLNENYLVDLASSYFRKVRMEKTIQEMQSALESEDIDAAEIALSGYESVPFGSNNWIDPFNVNVIIDALQEGNTEELIRFPGELGLFLTPHFERDGFISFVGSEKKGKSFWLMETVWQAIKQRRKVLYYVVGDMSQRQVMRRLACRVMRRSLYSKTVNYPISICKAADRKVKLEVVPRKTEGVPSLSDVVKAMNLILKMTSTKTSRLKMKCCGGSSISASDIETDIKVFIREGWVPDVIVVDYADLLAPEPHTKSWDYRHQINETWKIMRRISQDHHLLFVTATQAAASSYDSVLVRKKDFSEDKRKNAHVTGMLGINQTSEEKEQGIYRLNWVFLRDGKWTDTQVVWTAGCLALSNPCIVSVL